VFGYGALRHRIQLSGYSISDWRPTGLRARGLLRSLLVSYVALGATLYILPGRQASGPLAVLVLVIAVAVLGVVLRPVLAGVAVALGSFGTLAFGIVSQAVILDAAIAVSPDLDIHGDGEVLLVSWVAAGVAALVNWILDAGSEEAFWARLLGRAVWVAHRSRRAGDHSPAEHSTAEHSTAEHSTAEHSTPSHSPARLLILQFDGVGEDILRQAMTAGVAPTLAGWVRSGDYKLRGWHTGLPATTPAGQAVLLHGNETKIPAFRWWEKESGRLLVVNHPRDAAEIQQRLSDGQGLLAHGGVSVSNLFSGDAPTRLLTMSDARLPARTTRGYASFATQGSGLVRSLVVAGGQVLTELYQGRRQRRRDVEPRVRRGLVFAVQRAVTTALLRDLSVALVTEQIARGAPVIYVDLTDYDEIAHHAGPSRSESMQALEGLDRVANFFADVVVETGQGHEIVIVSDHGQAQGATFSQRSGLTLHEVVADLTADTAVGPIAPGPSMMSADSSPAERWGSANLLLTGVARSQGRAARVVNKAGIGQTTDTDTDTDAGAEVTVGAPPTSLASPADGQPALVVATSGSLAHIYLTHLPGRVDREEIDRQYPHLTAGLAGHPDVGAVMVRSSTVGGLVVLGTDGWRRLTPQGAVDGERGGPGCPRPLRPRHR
jgi:uncharacterized membrane protein YvlD (DUF360 family)